MSDLKEKLQAEIEMQAKVEALTKENRARQAYITKKKTTIELATIVQNEKELAIAKKTNFGEMSDEAISAIVQDNDEYLEAAKQKVRFINKAFDGFVPFFRKNLILIGGKTGEGKSTTVANIVYSTLKQINPRTGQNCRALVITNEEKPADVYNRITCHHRGWQYVGHDKFTVEQTQEFRRMIPILAKTGLTVIDNGHEGAVGSTTTIEGIRNIFDNLIRDEQWFDVVLIDYYQNVRYSKENPSLDEYRVQDQLAAALDHYKNVYPGAIVVLAQVNPDVNDEKKPFEHRIKGRKIICDKSTFIMEMVANRQDLTTNWVIHKSRFDGGVGQVLETGFDRGRFVEMTKEFIQARTELQSRRENAKLEKAIGPDVKQLEGKKK
jgi:hypothetical protein